MTGICSGLFCRLCVRSDSAHGRRLFQSALLIYLNFPYILLRLLSLRFACFCRCVRFFCVLFFCVLRGLRALRIALRMRFAGRVVKEKGEPRGENDHGSFPLVSLGQMSAAGCTHDPRFPSGESSLFFNY